jgi:hypothetical protein
MRKSQISNKGVVKLSGETDCLIRGYDWPIAPAGRDVACRHWNKQERQYHRRRQLTSDPAPRLVAVFYLGARLRIDEPRFHVGQSLTHPAVPMTGWRRAVAAYPEYPRHSSSPRSCPSLGDESRSPSPWRTYRSAGDPATPRDGCPSPSSGSRPCPPRRSDPPRCDGGQGRRRDRRRLVASTSLALGQSLDSRDRDTGGRQQKVRRRRLIVWR